MSTKRSVCALCAGVLIGVLAACGGEEAGASEAAERTPDSGATELPDWTPRERDPRAVPVTRALEAQDLAEARRLLSSLPTGVDAELYSARLSALEGDGVGAVRALEDARRRYPEEARVWAVAAEIHAWSGRLDSSAEELREGLERFGVTPDLKRARGVHLISREGGAAAGLRHLEEALRMDPGLEFTARPISQAHLLLGSQALSKGDAAAALRHAKGAFERDPTDVDVRTLLADALHATADFEGAIAVLETLLVEGQEVDGTLAMVYQRAGVAALLEKERETALRRYARARELGLPADELGFGSQLLAEESQTAVELGLEAYEKDHLSIAESEFRRAVRFDPDHLSARNHLAVVLFRRGKFGEAAEHWEIVLATAENSSVSLPEPVHLNLARSLYKAGRTDEVRPLLERYLRPETGGEWVAQTREMLDQLASEGH